MSVILRKSVLQKGYSFYFDISHKGKRWTEWTKIRVKNSDSPDQKREKIRLANQMRSERDRELVVLGKGLPNEVNLREQDFFDVYDELCAKRKNSKHIYENIRKKIKEFYGDKPLPIQAIDKPWMTRFLNFLKTDELAHTTVRQYFGFVGTILKEAMCLGYIVQNPVNLFSRHEKPKQYRDDADYLSESELESFLTCETKRVDPQLKMMFLFSCFTGLRWSDCMRVKWSNIKPMKFENETRQVIVITQKKTSKQVIVPLNPSALSLIEELRREQKDSGNSKEEFLFPKWSVKVEEEIQYPLRTKMAGEMKKWKKRAGFTRQFRFHMARHTYASWLIQNGVDLYTVSKLLGHSDISATTIYAHVSDQVKMQAASKLPFVDISKKGKQAPFTKVA